MTVISQPDAGRPGSGGTQPGEPARPDADIGLPLLAWLSSPVVQGGIAFLIYLLVWVPTAFRPIVHHLGRDLLDQKSMDPNLDIWCLRWWPYAIAHGLNPLFTSAIEAPAGHSLAWVTTMPPLSLLATPVTLTAGPVVAFNLLAAAALPLSAWAAFVFCRRLTGKFWAALAGGAVYGFSAYEMNHGSAGQLNLAYSLLLPLLAYLVVLWHRERISSRVFVILAGVLMAVQFYLFEETFADLTGMLVVGFLVAFAVAGSAHRADVSRLLKVTVPAYVVALVLASPYLAATLASKAPRQIKNSQMDLASLVVPRPGRTFGISWLAKVAAGPNLVSTACYVGIPLFAVVIVLAVTRWKSPLVRFLTIMLAFTIVASIGPVLRIDGPVAAVLPWSPLFHEPLIKNAYPARLMLFAYLVLAVVTAIFLAEAAPRIRWVNWARLPLGVLVLAFLVLDTIPISIQPHSSVPAFISRPELYRRNLTHDEIVVVVSNVGNAGLLWQAESSYYMRVAGGYINVGLSRRTDLPRVVQDLDHPSPARIAKFERFVQADHIGAVLLDYRHRPAWAGIFAQIGLRGHLSGGVMVYPVNRCASCKAESSATSPT